MPESKSNGAKSVAKKRPTNSDPIAKKTNCTKTSNTKSQRKISDIKRPAKKSASAKKPAAQVIDSFTVSTDRSKTTAGNADMDWSDLEKTIDSYGSETNDVAEEFINDGPTTTEELDQDQEQDTKKPISKKQPATKSRKIIRIIGMVIAGILSLSTIVLGSMIISINFLPSKYLIPAIVVLVVLALGLDIVMVIKRIKPAIKIPVFVVSTLLSVVYIVGIVYLNQTFNFFSSLRGQDYITEKYYVLVNKDSSYQDIHELQDKSIATYNENIPVYQDAIKQLNTFVKADLKEVDAINALETSLTSNEVDATFISAVHLALLDELASENSAKLSDTTRVLHTIEVKVAVDSDNAHPDIDISTQPFTVFISGIDSYGDISSMTRGRSDVNMLVTVNPNTHEILLTSIPRDYYVQLHGTTGTRDKLTHAGIYGVQMSMQTLEDLLGVEINYYVKVNFSTVTKLVDTIGGVDVYSDQQIRPWTNPKIIIPKGNVHMDGAMALAFARERKSYSTGDRHRVQNQQDVISAIIKKVSSSSVILTKYSEILSDLADCLSTNIGKDEISSLVKLQLDEMPSWQIGQYSLNGSDAHDYTYSMGQQMLYVMEPNLETVQTAHDNIKGIIEGKPLSELNLNNN